MPARRQLLQKITLNASATTLTFSNIPQTYTDLRLVISARTDRASDTDGASVRFNGDTGTNYSTRLLEGSGSAAQSRTFTSQTSLYVGQGVAGGSSTASTFGNAEAHIPNYTGSTQKAVLSRGTSENNAAASWMSLDASLWTGTAAITSITLLPVNGPNFLAGSTFYLYGITQVPVIVGGTETISGGYKIHTFTSTSSLQVVEAGPVEYLVVAGGGGGGGAYGNQRGGGAGAGGMKVGFTNVPPGNATVTVGGGGAGGSTSNLQTGFQGTGSSIGSIVTTTGGGGGGGQENQARLTGGSGGGAYNFGTGGSGVSGEGNAGGNGPSTVNSAGGGGGGKGAAGANGSAGGTGGVGLSSSISGIAVMYAGGGGTAFNNAAGGDGGGGAGNGNGTGNPGATNRGGGGGGAYHATVEHTGGSGGSGIVIIRYPYITN